MYYSIFNFIILFISKLSTQIELTLPIPLSEFNEPLTLLRSSEKTLFIASENAALLLNVETSISSNFNSFLSILNSEIDVISSSHPLLFIDRESPYYAYYSKNTFAFTCNSFSSSGGISPTNSVFFIKRYNATKIAFTYFYVFSTNMRISYGRIDCTKDDTIENNQVVQSSTYYLSLLIPYDNKNISIFVIDTNNNPMMTFSSDEFDSYVSIDHTYLQLGITYADSVALEDGGFIYCYNATALDPKINCLKLFFNSEGKLEKEMGPSSPLECPSNRDSYFFMYYLGNNRAIIGCGIEELIINIVNKDLTPLNEYITIADMTTYSNIIFTVVDINKLFVGGTRISQDSENNTLYKGGVLTFAIEGETFSSIEQIENLNNHYALYYVSALGAYKQCYTHCLSCTTKNGSHHCLICDNINGYYQKKDDIITCVERSSTFDRYMFDANEKAFLYCEKVWYKDDTNTNICADICPEGLYADREQNYLCVSDCSSSFLKNNQTRECVSYCSWKSTVIDSQTYCVDVCEGSYPYEIGRVCVSECPVDYPYVNEGMCVDMCPEGKIIKDNVCIYPIVLTEAEDIFIEVGKEEVYNYIHIEDYIEEGKNLIGDGFVIQIYPLNNPIENNTISTIDLGDCEQALRRENNINDNDTLLISKIDVISETALTPLVDYSIYDSGGRHLDMSVCLNSDILISYPILNTGAIEYEKAYELSSLGYDLYNPEDPFYNDKCTPFANNSVDVPLKDRREEFYIEVPFCGSNCRYEGINYTTNKVNCNCSVNEAETNQIMKFSSFREELFEQTNLLLFPCYRQITIENIRKNIGFYFSVTIFIMQATSAIYFFFFGMNHIYLKFKILIDKLNYDATSQIPTQEIDIDNCAFKDAQSKEERNIIYYFFFLFIKHFDIINILCYPGEFDVLSISFSCFLFSLASDYFMNALLFSDDVISQRYHNEGKLNLLTEYALSILSNIVSNVICIIAVKLTSFSQILELFALEHFNEKVYINKLNMILRGIKRNVILFFVFEFAMMGGYFYFLTIFCAVYKGSQWNWFTNGITSNVISIITTFCISILISVLRYIGLKCNIERVYYLLKNDFNI